MATNRFSILTCMLLMPLLFTGCGSESSNAPKASQPSEFVKKVDDRTVDLSDWRNASFREKTYFARAYTKLHLGKSDPGKEKDIRIFVDSSVNGMVKALRQRKADDEAIQQILSRTEVYISSKAGARIMGWPEPVNDI